MTRLSEQRTNLEWDQLIADIEKNMVHRHEAQKLYDEKKLKDGEMFALKGVSITKLAGLLEEEAWGVGMFMHGKFLYAIHPSKSWRLPRLKRQSVAYLLEVSRTGMVDTRQASTLPPRFQSLKNPDLVLHGKTSKDTDPESHTVEAHQQVFDEREEFQHPGLEQK